MSRFLIMLLLVLTPCAAFAQVTIESPGNGEQVATPFLVEGTAEPGQLLELVIDNRVMLVFRANSAGKFRIPVDVRTDAFTIRPVGEAELAATVAVGSGRVAERTRRVETAEVKARLEPEPEPAVEPETTESSEPEVALPASNPAVPEAVEEEREPRRPIDPATTAEVVELSSRETDTVDDVVEQIVPDLPAPEPEPVEAVPPAPQPPAATEDVVVQIVPTLGSADNQPVATLKKPNRRHNWKPWHIPSWLTQVPVGTVGGLLGAYVGYQVGYHAVVPLAGYPVSYWPEVATAALFYTAATGITVWAIGKAWGGKSPWWASMLGAAAGSAISAIHPAMFLGVPAVGSTIGYHLAAD